MVDTMLSHGVKPLTPVQRMKAAQTWRKVYNDMLPDYETDSHGWNRMVSAWLEGYAQRRGIKNKHVIDNILIPQAIKAAPDLRKVWTIFLIAIRARKQRSGEWRTTPVTSVPATAQQKPDDPADIMEIVKALLIEAGLGNCVQHQKEFRRICRRFYTLDEARRWCAYFIEEYGDNPPAAFTRMSDEPVVIPNVIAAAAIAQPEKAIVSAATTKVPPPKTTEPTNKEDKPVSITPKQWEAWLQTWHDKGYSDKQILNILSATSELAGLAPIERLREWQSDLDTATRAMELFHADYLNAAEEEAGESSPAAEPVADSTPVVYHEVRDRNAGCCTTTLLINGVEIKVTAFEGETGDEVAANIYNLFDGIRKFAQREEIREFGAIADGRDTVTMIKESGAFLKEQKVKRLAPGPEPASQSSNGKAASNSDGKSGVSKCSLIEVGKQYNSGEAQLQFKVAGFEKPLTFSKKMPEMVKLLKDVRTLDDEPFTAAMLEIGEMYAGKWQVRWEKNGKYTNVLAVEPA